MSQTDDFSSHGIGLDSPATNAAGITPNDVADLTKVTRGIYLGASGDLTVTLSGMADGASVTLRDLAGGGVHGLRIKRIWATGTTATDIVGMY